MMMVTVHLSNDFSRTCWFRRDDSFERAAADGVYDGDGFTFQVDARSHREAAETAFGTCNSYPDELHCSAPYRDVVVRYRDEGNRSLSVGDIVVIHDLTSPSEADGRYGCASFGFERF